MNRFGRTTVVVAAMAAAALTAACEPRTGMTAEPTSAPASSAELDGRIDATTLRSATVTVPGWSGPTPEIASQCRSGRIVLATPDADMLDTQLDSVVYADLDADPALETAALIRCQYGEAHESMVVAFDRDATGEIVTIGKVTEGVVWSFTAAAPGGVAVDISDMMACCSMSKDNEYHQKRTYAWGGSGFRQTAGPTSFAGKPYVTDLVLTTSALSFGPVQNGKRTGTITVKVRNAGPVASGRFDVSMELTNATTSSRYLHFSEEGDDCLRSCHEPLAAGATATLKFTVSAAADVRAGSLKLFVHAYGVKHPGSVDDPEFANNWATARILV
jgi:hypothetical protein